MMQRCWISLSLSEERKKKKNQLLISRLEILYSRWYKFLLGRKKYTTSLIFFCLSLFSGFFFFFFKWNWECDQPKLIVTLIFKLWEIWWWMWFSCKTRLVKLTQIFPVYQSINYIMYGFLTLLFKNPISFHKSEFPLSVSFNVLHTIKHRILIIRTYFLCG